MRQEITAALAVKDKCLAAEMAVHEVAVKWAVIHLPKPRKFRN